MPTGYLPTPSQWNLRLVQGSTLTHAQVDDNFKILNQKINDTEGLNIGTGAINLYQGKTYNADSGFLNFFSLNAMHGLSAFTSGNTIVIGVNPEEAEFCAYGITANTVTACDDCESAPPTAGQGNIVLGNNLGAGAVKLSCSGVTFNQFSTNHYTFPVYDGPAGYVLHTDGNNQLYWSAGSAATSGITADTYISNVTLVDDNLCITRSDGQIWCIEFSGETPYRYNTTNPDATRAIEPKLGESYAYARFSNIGGGSGNTIGDWSNYSNIAGGRDNFINGVFGTIAKSGGTHSFIGGGQDNLISGGTYDSIVGGYYNRIIQVRGDHSNSSIGFIGSGSGNTISGGSLNVIVGGNDNFIWNSGEQTYGAFIGAGNNNGITGNTNGSIIVGGSSNIIHTTSDLFSIIGGGKWNAIGHAGTSSFYNFIGSGINNAITATTMASNSIVGGKGNKIYGTQQHYGFIGGGFSNEISAGDGDDNAIVGGYLNKITSLSPFDVTYKSEHNLIGSGLWNKLLGPQKSVILAGEDNLISGGTYNLLGGGYQNQIINTLSEPSDTGIYLVTSGSSIVGGVLNTISGSPFSVIIGGQRNTIKGFQQAIVNFPLSSKYQTTGGNLIGGGLGNTVTGTSDSSIFHGKENWISHGGTQMILGGLRNKIIGLKSVQELNGMENIGTPDERQYSHIVGGSENSLSGTTTGSLIDGGYNNLIFGSKNSSIVGGRQNRINSRSWISTDNNNIQNIIVGGEYNDILGFNSYNNIIGGGRDNLISGSTNVIVGGESNVITGGTSTNYGFIGGGMGNKLNSGSTFSTIVGGSGNTSQSRFTFIGGGHDNHIHYQTPGTMTTDDCCHSVITGGRENTSTSKQTFQGGGRENIIHKESPRSIILGGLRNQIFSGTSYGFIGGGTLNFIHSDVEKSTILNGNSNQIISGSTNSHISNGYNNRVSGHTNFIGNGLQSLILSSKYGFIGNGTGNRIINSQSSAIVGGQENSIESGTTYSVIGGGYSNNILSGSSKSFIGGGIQNMIWQSENSTIGGGSGNLVLPNATNSAIIGGQINVIGTGSTYSVIGGGYNNQIFSGNSSFIGAGLGNIIKSSPTTRSNSSIVGAGLGNIISGSTASSILGGRENIIDGANISRDVVGAPLSTHNTIGGGAQNKIYGGVVTEAFIGGGQSNTILSDTSNISKASSILGGSGNTINVDVGYASILGGRFNTVLATNPQSSAIIGGDSLIAYSSQTTYSHGLDTDTDTSDGDRPFKYHGGFAWDANIGIPAAGMLLTSYNADGDAIWAPPPGRPHSGNTSDILTAYTSGCTLYLTMTNGLFLTADTCADMGPYQYAEGPNSIKPVLAGNFVSAHTSNITGGLNNKIIANPGVAGQGWLTAYCEIGGGGNGNRIYSGGRNSSILGGFGNRLGRAGLHNYSNHISNSTIVGGSQNVITGKTLHNTIVGGYLNKIYNTEDGGPNYAAIVNGVSNWARHEGSVIIGGSSLETDDTWTTFTRGLNVDSNPGLGGAKYLQYHGTLAEAGSADITGHYLKSVNSLGDSVWDIPRGHLYLSGDTYVTSAFTSGCTLIIINNSGTTFEVNLCNLTGTTAGVQGPYTYGQGLNSIVPILPGNGTSPPGFQANLTNSQESSIQSGSMNLINVLAYGKYNMNNILGGSGNFILSAQTQNVILNGNSNRIKTSINSYSSGLSARNIILNGGNNAIADVLLAEESNSVPIYNIIGNGVGNEISGSSYSNILNGQYNRIKLLAGSAGAGDSVYSAFIGGGDYNFINGHRAKGNSILNGSYNRIVSENSLVGEEEAYNSILGGKSNIISGNTSGSTIVNGYHNQIYKHSQTSTIAGGTTNKIYGSSTNVSILGGTNNTITASTNSTITSGTGNKIEDIGLYGSQILGGSGNYISGGSANIIGTGVGSKVFASYNSIILAGTNRVWEGGHYDFVGNGYSNQIKSEPLGYGSSFLDRGFNMILNGKLNRISGGTTTTILNGLRNSGLTATYSSIVGGERNLITSLPFQGTDAIRATSVRYSSILGGSGNTVYSDYGHILGGSGNTINDTATSSAIIGCNNLTAVLPNTTYMCALTASTISATTIVAGNLPLKHVDTRNYTAGATETITHSLGTEDIILNMWDVGKQRIDGQVVYVDSNNIEITLTVSKSNVKTVIIG